MSGRFTSQNLERGTCAVGVRSIEGNCSSFLIPNLAGKYGGLVAQPNRKSLAG